jgi:hypothetical protein
VSVVQSRFGAFLEYGQVVRHRFLAPGIKGSSPFIPIKENSSIGRAAVSKTVDMGSSPFFLEFVCVAKSVNAVDSKSIFLLVQVQS